MSPCTLLMVLACCFTIFQQHGTDGDSGWITVNEKLDMSLPFGSDTFSNYNLFLAGLPILYKQILRTSITDIVQDRFAGLELTYDDAEFSAHLCQDGYEIKAFGNDMLICSRILSEAKDSFRFENSMCIRSLKPCMPENDDNNSKESGEEEEDQYIEYSEENEVDDPNQKGSDEDDDSEDIPELPPANLSMPYRCVRDGVLSKITVCTKYGVQGFSRLGYSCASSRVLGEPSCHDCMPYKSCPTHQYVCGVLQITKEDEQALGVICCNLVSQNVVFVSLANLESSEQSSSAILEENIKNHFNNSLRDTFANAYFTGEGDYGFFFAVCPPDFFVQGYNGQQLLCSKEVHVTEVSYSENEHQECEQKICFPEDTEVGCIEAPFPKCKVCENTFISGMRTPEEITVCDDEELYGNSLLDRGVTCAEEDGGDSYCVQNSTVCGFILKKFLPNWSVIGFICCYSEEVPETLKDSLAENEAEFLEIHKMFETERITMRVEESSNEMSVLFDLNLQKNLPPNKVLSDIMSPIYNRKMWLLEELQVGSKYPETFIMCPINTYVRGIETSLLFYHFKILCSEVPPEIGELEVLIMGTSRVCPNLQRGNDFYTCGPTSNGERYNFCGDGKDWGPKIWDGQMCHKQPCGENNAVCGVTNSASSYTQALVICCEQHPIYPSRVPDSLDENGNLNEAAIKYIMSRLAKQYTIDHDGQVGTPEEVIAHYRKRNKFDRTLSITRYTDFLSAKVNDAVDAGQSFSDAFGLASEKTNFTYWISAETEKGIDPNWKVKAAICPSGSFVRGRTVNSASEQSILCSKSVPIIGKRYTKILGSELSCTMTTHHNDPYHTSRCTTTRFEYTMCSRGFYGLEANQAHQNIKCNAAEWCQDADAQLCGLLLVPNYNFGAYEAGICCKLEIPDD